MIIEIFPTLDKDNTWVFLKLHVYAALKKAARNQQPVKWCLFIMEI